MNNAMKKMFKSERMMGVNIENSHNLSSKDLNFTGFPPHPSFIISPDSLRRKGSSCSKPDTPKAHTHVTMTQLINTHSSRLQTSVSFLVKQEEI